MKAEYKEKLPQWYMDNVKRDLILTDDIDSLMSCAILKAVKNWDINYCLLFKADKNKNYDYMGITSNATNETVGVDLALQNGKCFDNHLSRLSEDDYLNKECINLNFIKNVTRKNYFKKYNLSTVLLLWSLYDLPIPECYYRLPLSQNRRALLSYYYRNYCRLRFVDFLSRLSFKIVPLFL